MIIDKDGNITEYNAAFAKDKSDADLLKYLYEPIGYVDSTPVTKEQTPETPITPTAGPAAPVKVAEPAAPKAPAEVKAGPTEPTKVEEAPAQSLEEWENKHIELSNSVAAKEKEMMAV
jgi:hypothetical protein